MILVDIALWESRDVIRSLMLMVWVFFIDIWFTRRFLVKDCIRLSTKRNRKQHLSVVLITVCKFFIRTLLPTFLVIPFSTYLKNSHSNIVNLVLYESYIKVLAVYSCTYNNTGFSPINIYYFWNEPYTSATGVERG